MAASDLFNLSFLFTALFSRSHLAGFSLEMNAGGLGVFPSTCRRIECPSFDVVHAGEGFEIRLYNSSMWISTQPIDDISFVNAGRIGFLQLFDYIRGKNEKHEIIEMTGPVLTEVKASDGPFCASSFVVSFYVPLKNQGMAPSAEGLSIRKWGPTLVAVRQFGGFVMDEDVGEQAASLYASLVGTTWLDAINKSHKGDSKTEYIVAQYNSPFEFRDRVNEIWFTFDVEESLFV